MRLNVFGGCSAVLLFCALPLASVQAQASKDISRNTNPSVPLKVGGDVSAPRPVYQPDPEYSEDARKAGAHGTCLLRLIVGTDGKSQDIRVERALGMGLDEKAVEAVRTWVFEPAKKDGRPVAVEIHVEVSFRLDKDANELFSPEQLKQMSEERARVQSRVYRDPVGRGPKVCRPSYPSGGKQDLVPVVTIAALTFEGSVAMPVADQALLSSSIRQGTYSGDRSEVTSQVLERTKAAWLEHGYWDVQVRGDANVLSSNPSNEQISVAVHVDEGPQYRLERISFTNNMEVTNVAALRSRFPIKDGDPFNRTLIADGLDNLRKAYLDLGHINFASIPNTTIDEANQTISLDIDIDEGKKFYVSRVDIMGLDEAAFQNVLNDLLVKPGDAYDRRLVELPLQKYASLLPSNSSLDSDIALRLDERAGTVAITYDFRLCGVE